MAAPKLPPVWYHGKHLTLAGRLRTAARQQLAEARGWVDPGETYSLGHSTRKQLAAFRRQGLLPGGSPRPGSKFGLFAASPRTPGFDRRYDEPVSSQRARREAHLQNAASLLAQGDQMAALGAISAAQGTESGLVGVGNESHLTRRKKRQSPHPGRPYVTAGASLSSSLRGY